MGLSPGGCSALAVDPALGHVAHDVKSMRDDLVIGVVQVGPRPSWWLFHVHGHGLDPDQLGCGQGVDCYAFILESLHHRR